MAVDDHGLEVLKKSGEQVTPGDSGNYYIKTSVNNSVSNPVPVILQTSTTATLTTITRSTTAQDALPVNSSRRGFILWNDSGANCFVRFGGTATTTDFAIRLPNNQGYETPGHLNFTGLISVIWSTGSSGSLLVTEFT
jgi:hypothetical protein